jgi:hypothetical protein
MNRFWLGLGAWTLACSAAAGPGACSARSPAHTVALLELYTSEGCSSCPPADQFLRGLPADGNAVRLSLHVDYWNYIGWKDPFSRAAFTERQRYLSDLARTRTIYTPEFFVGGREVRNWSDGMADAIRRVNATPARANIHIVLGTPGADGVPVSVGAGAGQGATLHVALVQNGIASQVRAGENQGRLLHHDHVVREWLAPVALDGDGKATLTRTVPVPAGAAPGTLGVAAFVQSSGGEILQALALPVCGG